MVFSVINSKGQNISEKIIEVKPDNNEHQVILDISSASKDILKIVVREYDETKPAVEEFFIFDSGSVITGSVIRNLFDNSSTYVGLISLVFIAIAVFIVKRILSLKKRIKDEVVLKKLKQIAE